MGFGFRRLSKFEKGESDWSQVALKSLDKWC